MNSLINGFTEVIVGGQGQLHDTGSCECSVNKFMMYVIQDNNSCSLRFLIYSFTEVNGQGQLPVT